MDIRVLLVCLVRGGSSHRGSHLQTRLKPPPKRPQVQAGHSDNFNRALATPTENQESPLVLPQEEENAYKSADKHSSRSRSRSPGRKPHSPSKKSAPASTQQNLHHIPPGGGQKQRRGSRTHPTGIITSGKLGGNRGSQVCILPPSHKRTLSSSNH
ncbi:hypothetical protein HPB52_025511 [Rhipicephalus sanguineus]|uniref:Uncharacterized protein n=1 Tax=Rhipicephalus sanguineus TaxID=34632 RepID=A0A9D4TCZ1_RHISA|nr:hypothetical protein HPB52_025511 [Rhipicephalus sanguineus]